MKRLCKCLISMAVSRSNRLWKISRSQNIKLISILFSFQLKKNALEKSYLEYTHFKGYTLIFATNSDFLNPISLDSNVVDLRYFKL